MKGFGIKIFGVKAQGVGFWVEDLGFGILHWDFARFRVHRGCCARDFGLSVAVAAHT